MNCKIRHRKPAKNGFCELHLKAHQNIVNSYTVCHKALGISWKEYLSQTDNNPLTGEYTKEAAKYLISNEEAKNDKKS